MLINKKPLLSLITTHLQQELNTLKTAANNAHLAAIDDQSVAETQYDTLAIEAGYLAEGQSRRVLEIKLALQQFNELASTLDNVNCDDASPVSAGAIGLGSLVQLQQGEINNRWFFIAPAAAGFTAKLPASSSENDTVQTITVITEQSPVGQVLIDMYEGDDVVMPQGSDIIAKVY